MKLLVKIMFLLFVFTNVHCSERNVIHKKIEKLSLFDIDIDKFSFVDGLKISNSKYSDFFTLSINMPECCQVGRSEIYIQHKVFISDTLLIKYKEEVIYVENNVYPKYWANTLNVSFFQENPIISFVTSLEDRLGGLDPINLILWVYYEDVIYKFSVIVPVHQDWEWNTTYQFQPDDKLREISNEVYNKIIEMWKLYIEKYKIWYQKG
jgi:hypothetical protein